MKTLLYFTAPWCVACRQHKPVVEAVAEQYGLMVEFVDVEQDMSLAQTYSVMSLPTIVPFVDGEPADSIVGATSKATLVAHLTVCGMIGDPDE